MKKFYSALCLSALVFAPSFGELNSDNYTSEMLLTRAALDDEEDGSPFSIDLSAEWTGKADFEHKKCFDRLKTVQFGMAEIDASMVFYYNKHCKEGLLATAAYTYTQIQWTNPYFDQNDFDTVSFAIGGFTERADRWTWKGEIRLNADVRCFDINNNLFWNLVLAGRHAYSDCVGLNVGFIAFTGMKIDRLYPILGFDWKINDSWQLNLVYPTNIALVYTMNQQWSFGVSWRAFDERHRVCNSKFERWDKGLIEYRAAGLEAGVNFTTCDGNWLANLHVGELFGGRIKVSTRDHHQIKRFNFNSTPYLGGEIAGKF